MEAGKLSYNMAGKSTLHITSTTALARQSNNINDKVTTLTTFSNDEKTVLL